MEYIFFISLISFNEVDSMTLISSSVFFHSFVSKKQ